MFSIFFLLGVLPPLICQSPLVRLAISLNWLITVYISELNQLYGVTAAMNQIETHETKFVCLNRLSIQPKPAFLVL
jgi:hypothetical protein